MSRYLARGFLNGQQIESYVDSEVARDYLEKFLSETKSRSESRISGILNEWDARAFTSENLRLLAKITSLDFAALYFVSRILGANDNRVYQQKFQSYLENKLDLHESAGFPEKSKKYLFAFVPGFAYKSDTTTGADFANERETLDKVGFTTTLIETNEIGTIEENADFIASWILEHTNQDIILVSASKAGPEVALALGNILPIEQTRNIKAWLSIGGILRGTPVADEYLHGPRNWLARIIFWWLGFPRLLIENLSNARRRKVFETIKIPKNVLTLQYVGVPLSGQVTKRARSRYKDISHLGPNDGLTLLTDELVPDGKVVTTIGLDHYYKDPEISTKTLALARVILDSIVAN